MKTNSVLGVCAIVCMLALCLSACSYPTTEIKTTVNSDGSIDKVLKTKVKRDSKFDYEQVLRGAGYRTKPDFKIDSSSEDLVFSKHFKDISELQTCLLPATDSTTGIEVKFSKRFRWFYTYYTYTETYKAHPLFAGLPIDKFVKQSDLLFLHRADTSTHKRDSVERIVKKGFDQLFGIAVERMIENGMAKYPDSIKLKKKAPGFTHCLSDALPSFSLDDTKRMSAQVDTFILRHYRGSAPVDLKPYLMSRMDGWNRVVQLFMVVSMSESKNILEMPGTIDTTNASVDNFLTTSWTVSFYDHLSDYEMRTESREINTVLYVISVVIIFLLVLYASWRFVLFVQRH